MTYEPTHFKETRTWVYGESLGTALTGLVLIYVVYKNLKSIL